MTSPAPPPPAGPASAAAGRLASWWPELVLAGTCLVLGTVDAVVSAGVPSDAVRALPTVLAMTGALAAFRRNPAAALALVWVAGFAFLAVDVAYAAPPVLLLSAVVAYGCARHGDRLTLWASGLSIPAAGLLLAALAVLTGRGLAVPALLGDLTYDLVVDPVRFGVGRLVVVLLATLVGAAVLYVPWLAGLALRARDAQGRAEQQREAALGRAQAASDLAALRASQTQLANDVHDVVGHSLAVILAQAESAQFRDDDDIDGVRESLAHIATAARQSLRDVRQVLSTTRDGAPPAPVGDLTTLVDGIRSAGRDVDLTVVGTPRPLPPELATVAYRVLQEMLTNALKHGVRDESIRVEQHWADELRIEVVNATEQAVPGADGHGLDGMRRRLRSVGGRLDLRRRPHARGAGSVEHTATAWVPLRATPYVDPDPGAAPPTVRMPV